MKVLHGRDFARDIDLVKNVTAKLDKRISNEKIPQDKIDGLTGEELLDLNKIVGLANFMLCKYEDKKETKILFESFVEIIENVGSTIDGIDDEIVELLITTENSISKIKCMHATISEKSDMMHVYGHDKPDTREQTC